MTVENFIYGEGDGEGKRREMEQKSKTKYLEKFNDNTTTE